MKKGFTLVELLAVIVILALVALITIPVILNVIEKSKQKTYQRSIDAYGGAVNKAIAEYILDHEKDTTKILTYQDIQSYIKYEGNKVECTVNIYQDKTIYLANCKVNNESVAYTYGIKQGEGTNQNNNKLCTLVGEKAGTEEINRGDKYKCEVIKGMEEPYTFYVLSTEGDKVNLIMDRNICGYPDSTNPDNGKLTEEDRPCLIAWYSAASDNTYGPVTAMQGLYNATKNWNNVSSIDLSGTKKYTDENNKETNDGYTEITTNKGVATIVGKPTTKTTTVGTESEPLRARLPKLEEVYNTETDASHCHEAFASCPTWLVENLDLNNGFLGCINCSTKYADTPQIDNIRGYWTLSSYHVGSYGACNVGYWGGRSGNPFTSEFDTYGLRPVITVSLSDLS